MSLKRIVKVGIESSATLIGTAFSAILLVLTAMNAGPLWRDEPNTFNLALKKMSLCHGSYGTQKNIPAVEYRQQKHPPISGPCPGFAGFFSIVSYPRDDELTT
jgi:hypothetical protein